LVDGAADAFPDRVAFVREDGVATIDLVGTRPDATTVHRRVGVPATEGGDDPAVLALRAAELLRGIRLEVRRAPARPPADAARATAALGPPPPRVELLRVSAGGSLLAGGFDAWPAAGPTLAADAAVVRHLRVALGLAGPYFQDLTPTPAGSAHTRQELGHLGLRFEGDLRRTRLQLLLGWGFHHLRAEYDMRGTPPGPPSPEVHVRTPQSIWTPFVVVGAGVGRRVWRRLGASFDVAALFLKPNVDIAVNGQSVGKLGGPSVMESLSLWIALP
jgi:hypothetical protein